MASVSIKCHSCGTEMSFSGQPGRRDECPKCHADAHVCRNCKHYDPAAYNECREPSADRVQEKDRANFCDFFYGRDPSGVSVSDKQKDLRAAAEALFKKK